MSIEIVDDEDLFLAPLKDKEHELEVKRTINDMLLFVKELPVNNEASYKKITSLYSQARSWKKSIEATRKEMVAPLRKQESIINDKSKEISDPLESVIEIANSKAASYLNFLEQAKRKEEEELRAQAAIFDAEDEVYVPPVPKVIRGEGAIMTTKIEKSFRVVDITKVPTKYLIVDEDSVKKDLKLGIDQIEGLEVLETTKTTLRTR